MAQNRIPSESLTGTTTIENEFTEKIVNEINNYGAGSLETSSGFTGPFSALTRPTHTVQEPEGTTVVDAMSVNSHGTMVCASGGNAMLLSEKVNDPENMQSLDYSSTYVDPNPIMSVDGANCVFASTDSGTPIQFANGMDGEYVWQIASFTPDFDVIDLAFDSMQVAYVGPDTGNGYSLGTASCGVYSISAENGQWNTGINKTPIACEFMDESTLAVATQTGVDIFDISDITSPSHITSFEVGNVLAMSATGSYIYVVESDLGIVTKLGYANNSITNIGSISEQFYGGTTSFIEARDNHAVIAGNRDGQSQSHFALIETSDRYFDGYYTFASAADAPSYPLTALETDGEMIWTASGNTLHAYGHR